MPREVPSQKTPRVGHLLGLEIKDGLLEAVREAVAQGEPGLTFGAVAELFDLSYHHAHSAVHELAIMGVVGLAHRSDSNVRHIVMPGWEPPPRPELTAKQRGALEYLASIMDDEGIAYTSYKDISLSYQASVGGIICTLDSLDRKGYISILLRGKGARRTLFKVYPEGDGPQELSPFGHSMIGAPAHLGIPAPNGFSHWARGKSVQEGIVFYERCAPVIRRWFMEVGVTPARKEPERAATLVYPFLTRDRGTPEHGLLKRVSAAVPMWLPPDRRADICQDLMVGILCGDISEDSLELSAKLYIKDVLQQHPTQFGDAALDAPIGKEGDFTLMDTLVAEPTHWDWA